MSLSKRLLWLNGIAIIAVAMHHAAAFSLQAMFEWTDRYMTVIGAHDVEELAKIVSHFEGHEQAL